MGSPEGLVVLVFDCPVEGVGNNCLLEWRSSRIHNEQNHSAGEYIDVRSAIFAEHDLRCHIPLRTDFFLENTGLIRAFNQGREAEVHDFESVVVGDHNVFGLEIPVADSTLVHMLNSVHQLQEEGAAEVGLEMAGQSNIIEQFPAADVLNNGAEARIPSLKRILLSTVGRSPLGLLQDGDELHDVGVAQY